VNISQVHQTCEMFRLTTLATFQWFRCNPDGL
jgi:hypothetical protein